MGNAPSLLSLLQRPDTWSASASAVGYGAITSSWRIRRFRSHTSGESTHYVVRRSSRGVGAQQRRHTLNFKCPTRADDRRSHSCLRIGQDASRRSCAVRQQEPIAIVAGSIMRASWILSGRGCVGCGASSPRSGGNSCGGVVPLYFAFRAFAAHIVHLDEENRRRGAMASFDQGMSVIDMNGVITLWNEGVERLLGCPRSRAVGRTLLAAVPAVGKTELPRAITDVVSTGTPRTLAQLTLPADAGGRTRKSNYFRSGRCDAVWLVTDGPCRAGAQAKRRAPCPCGRSATTVLGWASHEELY